MSGALVESNVETFLDKAFNNDLCIIVSKKIHHILETDRQEIEKELPLKSQQGESNEETRKKFYDKILGITNPDLSSVPEEDQKLLFRARILLYASFFWEIDLRDSSTPQKTSDYLNAWERSEKKIIDIEKMKYTFGNIATNYGNTTIDTQGAFDLAFPLGDNEGGIMRTMILLGHILDIYVQNRKWEFIAALFTFATYRFVERFNVDALQISSIDNIQNTLTQIQSDGSSDMLFHFQHLVFSVDKWISQLGNLSEENRTSKDLDRDILDYMRSNSANQEEKDMEHLLLNRDKTYVNRELLFKVDLPPYPTNSTTTEQQEKDLDLLSVKTHMEIDRLQDQADVIMNKFDLVAIVNTLLQAPKIMHNLQLVQELTCMQTSTDLSLCNGKKGLLQIMKAHGAGSGWPSLRPLLSNSFLFQVTPEELNDIKKRVFGGW
eukprot:CAMPEP_0113868664 /NCGR_PEP_ID=MMETSP0780_2-20120614/1116_1 /TAXON_ID=652834 /ORGANISM="Palpitomonas bilix" /LENGTH=434 /DNA_ID=CAMNT_0000853775 /DNA_START=299 /DNA_END=1601 /DNA_ORIENTATION=- /assembly_acc=CAM_ASM_000599